MESLMCTQCGAPINRYSHKCEYCGTQYKINETLNPIILENPKFKVIQCEHKIFKEDIKYIPLEHIGEMCMHEMAKDLAVALMPYVEVSVSNDVIDPTITVTSRLRVADKDFRF